MKKINFNDIMSNVGDRHIEEAAIFVPKHNRNIRWIALAACLAIIVTAVPFAFILNKEPADTIVQQQTTTPTKQPTDPEKGLPDGFYYTDMQTIELSSNNKLVFNTQFLTDGKNIYANLDKETRPYIFEYAPLTNKQKQAIIEDLVEKASNYHNNEDAKIDSENFIGSFNQTKYSITTNKHLLQTKIKYIVNSDNPGEKCMALHIGGTYEMYYDATSWREPNHGECVYECIEPLKEYLSDVLGINELSEDFHLYIRQLYTYTDEYYIKGYEYERSWVDQNAEAYDFGARYRIEFTIFLDPAKNNGKTQLGFVFYTDNPTDIGSGDYYLTEIYTEHSFADQYYVELIDEKTAIDWLIRGYCIGNVGQFVDGCRLCTAKYQIPAEEYIPNNLECSLVYIPEVVCTTDDKSVTYDMPFYAFTVPSEIEGQRKVAYVPATEIKELNEFLKEQTMAECVYRDHSDHGKLREDYTGKLGK